MSKFRENIATASADAELCKRVAPRYVEAYKQIA